MYGIVSLLDEEHDAKIRSMWAAFATEYGLQSDIVAPIPHISYHVAMRYDALQLGAFLRDFARQMPSFTLRTNGLALFTGAQPALYIPVLKNDFLTRWHQALWASGVERVATNARPYYHPAEWIPHITLAEGGLNHTILPQIIRALSPLDFCWSIQIDNLAVISSEDGIGIVERYALNGEKK